MFKKKVSFKSLLALGLIMALMEWLTFCYFNQQMGKLTDCWQKKLNTAATALAECRYHTAVCQMALGDNGSASSGKPSYQVGDLISFGNGVYGLVTDTDSRTPRHTSINALLPNFSYPPAALTTK